MKEVDESENLKGLFYGSQRCRKLIEDKVSFGKSNGETRGGRFRSSMSRLYDLGEVGDTDGEIP